ncbi:hypothetical protein TNCV_3222341 [Trichonephila clavipes]|nr:hypothetical protein TNCV_3222341 [Trichonephila clavipes]
MRVKTLKMLSIPLAKNCHNTWRTDKKLQPLDVGINRSFKSKVRKLWEQWMSDGEKNYTKTGKLKRASYENVSRWVLKAWNDVAETTVNNAFRKCNIIVKNDSDDEESLLSSDSDVLREDLINLFISESDESDFEGFFNS